MNNAMSLNFDTDRIGRSAIDHENHRIQRTGSHFLPLDAGRLGIFEED